LESLRGILDMSGREKAILVPLILLTIFFGVYPAPLLDVTTASVDNLITQYQAALAEAVPLGAAETAALAR
jgi:NADH-quinone oxidoreductase subunit M